MRNERVDDVLVSQGLVLMLVGFGTVFLFLLLLWAIMSVTGRIIPNIVKPTDSGDLPLEDDAELAIAIALAVKANRDFASSSGDM